MLIKRVSKKEAGSRLLQFLRAHTDEHISAKALKKGIDGKLCTINGHTETFSTHILKEGDRVCFNLEGLSRQKTSPISILYQDDDLLVIDKPVGLICEPKGFFKPPLHLVHRLDKETSGALILAKTVAMKNKLLDLFKNRKIDKFYLAIVDGQVKEKEGRIDNFLGKKHQYQGQTIYGAVPPKKGLRAVTTWQCLKSNPTASLLYCQLHTGRTHQLRAHLSGIGHPILGDVQYAKTFHCPLKPHRTQLHAYRIHFTHPTTLQPLSIKAPIPTDFQKILEQVKLDHFFKFSS